MGKKGSWEGCQRWSEREARSALADFARSGQSLIDFAESRGFSPQRLWFWRKRLGAGATAEPAFVAVSLPTAAPSRSLIEIVVGDVAVRVREDLDVEHLARLVDALARRARGC